MQWEHSATGTVIFDGRMQMSGPDLNLLPHSIAMMMMMTTMMTMNVKGIIFDIM